MGVDVTFSAIEGKALDARYTHSLGISPSIVSVRVVPVQNLPLTTDVIFTDGDRTLTIPGCRIVDVPASYGFEGRTFNIQMEDHRWWWKTGYIDGEYNFGLREGITPATGSEEAKYRKTAKQLAQMCLEEMAEFNYDVSVLSDDDFPYVNWDYENPAKALADLCDRYGCTVAYDPFSGKVSIVVKGQGADLDVSLPFDSYDNDINPPESPNRLLGVCEYDEHEVELDLEAVGLDIDGTVKLLKDLSYKPAAGFIDETHFTDVDEDDTAKTVVCAKKSVFRWYRVKSPQTIPKWKGKTSVIQPELLPISQHRITTGLETNDDGTSRTMRKEAYCFGVIAVTDPTVDDNANTAATYILPENFSVREATGLVEFSRPIFKYDGDAITGADLKLRTTVWGPRYTREKSLGGLGGTEIVPIRGVARQFVYTADAFGGGTFDNTSTVDQKIDDILNKVAKQYEEVYSENIRYVGLYPIVLDGKIQQATYDVGGGGAFTTASASSEHSYSVPSMDSRRDRERNARNGIEEGLETFDEKNRAEQYEMRGD